VKLTPPRNPNKWGKTLAPWFEDKCREAKKELATSKKLYSKEDNRIKLATQKYFQACKLGKQEFAKQTPDMLKYQPKRFWGMLRSTTPGSTDMSAKTFAEYN
jgi:hypothetical protein